MNPMEEIIRSAESAQLRALPAQTACQGVAGAFSHKACLEVFEQPDIQFYPSFEEVFAAVSSGQRRYGVIPIENTLAGSVTDNYDLMLQYGLYIVGSVKVKIEHALLALPNASLEELRQVYSHEQALHQCSDFLKAHPQLTARPYSNTAASAKLVAEQKDPSLAAFGPVRPDVRIAASIARHPKPQRQLHPLCHPGKTAAAPSRLPAHQPDCAGAAPRRCPVQRPFPLCGARHQPAQARVPTHPGQPV